VGNAVECFLRQTYKDSFLLVYDDTGHFNPVCGQGWILMSSNGRHSTLSEKYNHMVQQAGRADIFVVWEDDDIYLPWHIEANVQALEERGAMWAHPSQAWALTTGKPVLERVGGNMHASLVMRREAVGDIGGWPNTKRADFDLQLLAQLRRRYGAPADPVLLHKPSYMFRWGSTGTFHGQSFGSGPSDETWYEKAALQTPYAGPRDVVPCLDQETAGIYATFADQQC